MACSFSGFVMQVRGLLAGVYCNSFQQACFISAASCLLYMQSFYACTGTFHHTTLHHATLHHTTLCHIQPYSWCTDVHPSPACLLSHGCLCAGRMQHNSILLRSSSRSPGLCMRQMEDLRRQHHVSQGLCRPARLERAPHGCRGHSLCRGC